MSRVEVLFRQQFRVLPPRWPVHLESLPTSAPMALQRITDAGDRSLILGAPRSAVNTNGDRGDQPCWSFA
jgi:hypothetical protein